MQGVFIYPTLKFNMKEMYFKYSWEKNVNFMPITRVL